MKRLGVGLCAALVALAGVACGEPGERETGGGDQTAELLAGAADKAEAAGSARADVTMEISAGGQAFDVEGEGEFDFVAAASAMTMTMTGPQVPGEQTIEMVMEGPYVYTRMSPLLGGGRGWVRMDADLAMNAGLGGQVAQDPVQYLGFLRSVAEGEIEPAGTEEIDGVPTTHYKTEVSFDDAGDDLTSQFGGTEGGPDSVPIEVWLDDEGMPRRMKLGLSGRVQSTSFEIQMTVDFSDFGADVEITAPKKFDELDV